jgi:ribosome maturation factor RimP
MGVMPIFYSQKTRGNQVSSKLEQLQALLAPVVEALGYVCWGVEYISQGRHSLLRVYIDHPNGILVEDCEAVSRQVSGVLDVEDPITNEYTLEVSSPGMDRPLFTLEQFAAHAGEQVKVKLRSPFEGRRNFQGLLRGVEDQDVVVQVDEHEYLLPIEMIDKANVVPRFE